MSTRVKNAVTATKHHCNLKAYVHPVHSNAKSKVSAFDNASNSSLPPLTPNQVLSAYSTSKYSPNGKGTSIAIIVAYNYPNIQSDLNDFCNTFNLPKKQLIIHNIDSSSSLSSNSWNIEACLDTQYATLMASNADIHVVFAKTDSISDFRNALIYTNTNIQPDIMSMSWGIEETTVAKYSLQSLLEDQFNDSNTFYLSASGDNLSVSYPSTSGNVIAVGGSTLVMNGNSRAGEWPWSEAGNSGGGKGISCIFPRPAYQINANSSPFKMAPDISLIANTPNQAGVMVCNSGNVIGVGGTSLSCPLLAGIIATGISYRNAGKKPALTQSTLLTSLYNMIQPDSPCSPLEGVGAVNQKFISYLQTI